MGPNPKFPKSLMENFLKKKKKIKEVCDTLLLSATLH